MAKDNKPEFEDDGKTIADMNVEGMPWYNPRAGKERGEEVYLSPKEKFGLYKGIFLAVLLVVSAFFLTYFFLILFLTKVWN